MLARTCLPINPYRGLHDPSWGSHQRPSKEALLSHAVCPLASVAGQQLLRGPVPSPRASLQSWQKTGKATLISSGFHEGSLLESSGRYSSTVIYSYARTQHRAARSRVGQMASHIRATHGRGHRSGSPCILQKSAQACAVLLGPAMSPAGQILQR